MRKSLHVLILGTAAGGGLPQWNCGCKNCFKARQENSGIVSQTQSSLAVSADGEDWAILNASPDIRYQLQSHAALHPGGLRHAPFSSVLLTNGDIDHIAGLLVLREKQAFRVYLTAGIMKIISQNPIFDVLDRNYVDFVELDMNSPFALAANVEAELFSVPGKVPLFMEGESVETQLEGDQTVGVRLSAFKRTAYYIPACARITDGLAKRLTGAELVFFDGTTFENNEMTTTGTGTKTSERMGHMPMNGSTGSIAAFSNLGVKRKIYIHINNTNPVWDVASSQRSIIENAGWKIGFDGLEVQL